MKIHSQTRLNIRAADFIGESILYKWPKKDGSWALGKVVASNKDSKVTVGGEIANFKVHYEKDDSDAMHVLSVKAYATSADSKNASWVLVGMAD